MFAIPPLARWTAKVVSLELRRWLKYE